MANFMGYSFTETIRRCIGLCIKLLTFALVGIFILTSSPAWARNVLVAVAANFMAPAHKIAAAFHSKTGYGVELSFGSSGQFYAQIKQGAPFEVFLSADAARPQKAEADGLAVPGSVFTYAIGKLVLWSANAQLVDPHGAILRSGTFTHIANCNPDSAPYGTAGIQTLKALGLYNQIDPKIVTAANLSQAYQFIASGNAELGFVALSQVMNNSKGSKWIVPQTLYSPIIQDAVLLKTGAKDPGARAFLAFLKSKTAIKIIHSYGYSTPGG